MVNQKKHSLTAPVPLAAALIVLVTASAQAAADAGGDRLEEVQVTAGRVEQDTGDVSAAVTVLNRSDLDRMLPRISVDVLRGQTGAFVQQTTPGQGIPVIRGLKGSEVLHLVDGMRLNNALFRNAPNQYLALLDPMMTARVEVLRGPASTLYGSDAMGGVVHFITEDPRFGSSDWEARGRLLTRFASGDMSSLAHVSGAIGRDGIGFSGGATYLDAGDRRSADRERLSPSGYRARSAFARAHYESGERHEWGLGWQYLRQPSTPRYDELAAGFGQDAPSSEEFFFEPNQRLFYHLQYRYRNPASAVDMVEAHIGFQRVDDDRRNRDFGSAERRTERNRSDLLGITLQVHSALMDRHSLTWGFEVYLDEVSSARWSVDVETGIRDTVSSRFPDGSTMNTYGVYLNDEIAFGDRWHVTAGARWTRIDETLPAADRGVSAKIDEQDVTGHLGTTFEIAPGVHWVANLGRGFRAPNIFDLGTLGARPGNRFNIANPDLNPETVVTLDTGLKWQADNWRAEAVVWVSRYRDKITSVLTGDVDDAGRDVVQSRNADRVDLHGFEFGGRYLLGDTLYARTGLTYTRGKEIATNGDSQPADRIPPWNLSISLRGEYTDWWWQTSMRTAARQDRLSDRDIRDSRINPNGTAGWASLDLSAGWQVTPVWRLQGAVENLLDKRYREHASGIDVAGRSFSLQIEAGF